jgi:LPXTG-motif cell wall-anchored protein
MKNTPITTTLLLLTLFTLFALPAHAVVTSTPNLNASLLYYTPVPATPGALLDVYIQIENSGTTAQRVSVTFIDNAPFSVDSEQDRVKSTDSIPSQQSFLAKYQVRVSKDALPGTNYIKIQYSIEGSTSVQTMLLPIDITSNSVSLDVSDVKLDPAVIAPGSTGTLTLTLHNSAQLKISSGVIRIDLSGVDIAPIGSTNQQRYTDVQPGEDQIFTFNLAPSPSIASGVYKIPVQIAFIDQQGRAYNMTEYIGIRVGAKPDISVIVDSSKLTSEQKTGDVIIRVTNKGLGEVKFVDVTVQPSDTYTLRSSSSEQYVGNIDSDDYKTALVTILAKGNDITIPVKVTYMDALNTPYTIEEDLHLHLYSTSTGGFNTTWIIVIVVVIAGAVYFFVRKRKK